MIVIGPVEGLAPEFGVTAAVAGAMVRITLPNGVVSVLQPTSA